MRSASAADPTVDSSLIWPYSLLVVPNADRIIVTSFVMEGFPHSVRLPIGSWSESKTNANNAKHVQIWSLSELKLLLSRRRTVTKPHWRATDQSPESSYS